MHGCETVVTNEKLYTMYRLIKEGNRQINILLFTNNLQLFLIKNWYSLSTAFSLIFRFLFGTGLHGITYDSRIEQKTSEKLLNKISFGNAFQRWERLSNGNRLIRLPGTL